MDAESCSSEQEEVTTIYKKSRRRHRRYTSGKKSKETKTETAWNRASNGVYLSPFLEGHIPSKSPNSLKSDDNNGIISPIKGKEVMSSKRIFLGHTSDDEEDELSELRTVRVWKLKTTNRKGFDRFRKIVESVKFVLKICRRPKTHGLTQEESILFFMDTKTSENQKNGDSENLFDVTPFRSLGEKNLVNTMESFLESPSHSRTDHDITTMQHLLMCFSRFSIYPQHIQRGLCKYGWFSRFEKSKIIAREGNRAEVYYLILTGVAISRCVKDAMGSDERRKQMAEFQRRGDIIGEKEILTNSDRSSTVVCKENMTVLGVDKEDLLCLFKGSGRLECIDFLRTVPELDDFPLELLPSNRFSCSVHHYRRGAVIVKNSSESEWIYIIKSGSCQVFKAIKRPAENQPKPTKQLKDCMFPDIDQAKPHRKSLTDISNRNKKRPGSKQETSKVVLPQVNNVRNSLVSRGSPSPSETPTPRKSKGRKKSAALLAEKKGVTEGGATMFYAKLDLVTERQCFGLQSLVYDDIPSFSLVSNGAECVLIAKQFLRNHLDNEIRRRLVAKMSAYPSLSKLQELIDDEISWESYKDKVIHDSFR